MISKGMLKISRVYSPAVGAERRVDMKQFAWVILAVLLAGCTTIATQSYDVATDERSVGTQASDTDIFARIKKELAESKVKGTDSISVFCRNGIVVLAGVVPKGSEAGMEAVRIARGVQGVRKVETYFLPSQPSRTSDFEISEKIHYKMVGDVDLKADQVDMTVIDGHVVLVGMVSSKTKVEKIIGIARETKGVKVVKSFIQVKR
jgi:hyperosmotically inducible periplasmic protein